MINGYSYKEMEAKLLRVCVSQPDHILELTHECVGIGFTLYSPQNIMNGRSDYKYAQEFYEWLKSGDTDLTDKIKEMNPFAERFVDKTGLPESFSSTYGQKINRQMESVVNELKKKDSRRAYLNILIEEDKAILDVDTTHEYPCTIGIHFMVRENILHAVVNMRSNNIFSVLPYDVYNFTRLQIDLALKMGFDLGFYTHFINSCHIYKRDIPKIKDYLNNMK